MTRKLQHPELFDEFSIWLHDEPGLQTCDGINVTDIDKAIHRFCFWKNGWQSRVVQVVMFLEIKSRGAELRAPQRDELFIYHQLLTTNAFPWQVSDSNGQFKKGHVVNNRRVKSYYDPQKHCIDLDRGREIDLNCQGVFLLRMSGKTPVDSSPPDGWMEWSCAENCFKNSRRIDFMMLKELLRFEINPCTFEPWDPARRRKKVVPESSLFSE